ncbi:MAG: PDZ domain-containing protein [Cyanobacteria bacterium HKST-UBA01]|nr:PDZ domain-containing protein [Cyanobacteria bacterium HKST-UBA01]
MFEQSRIDDNSIPKTNLIERGINSAPEHKSALQRPSLPQTDQNLPLPDLTLISDAQPATCPPSPVYNRLIDRALRRMYDPASLGNVDVIRNKYNCQIKNVDDAIKYADEAVHESGDHYNDVLPPKEATAQKEAWKGEITGIGVTLGKLPEENPTEKGPVRVESVVAGAPAEKHDLRKGDIITHVDGESLDLFTYDETVGKIRGPVDKTVTITLTRDGKPQDVTLERAPVEIANLEERRLDGNIGYVRLYNFTQEDTVEDVKKALEKHKDADSYIIDLRNNPGGIFQNGYKLAALFLDSGTLLKTRERTDSDPSQPTYLTETYKLTDKEIVVESEDETSHDKDSYTEKREPDIINKPFIVLVNGGSASSSEIFIGAIKASKEGLIMGSKTYGKGIGQSIFTNMPGGSSLQVTAFRIFTPDGHWAGDAQKNRIGITPDMVIDNPDGATLGSADDKQLEEAKKYLHALTMKQ